MEKESAEKEVDDEFLDMSDEEFDQSFIQIKEQIKNQAKNPKLGYYCKVCGKFHNAKFKIPHCIHCHIPICRKCSSLSFCLNCFVNITEDSRKTLKLTWILAISMPFLSLFLIFQGWEYFLLSEFLIILTLIGIHYYSRWYVNRHSSLCFDANWENIIKSQDYQALMDPTISKRYLPPDFIKEEQQKIEKRKKLLSDWIENAINPKIPQDLLLENEEKLENESVQTKITVEELIKQNYDIEKEEEKESISYKYIKQPCPKCKEEINFADFCPNCNIKFCPKCNVENNPYNRICICKFIFPPLEREYFKWTGKKEIEIIGRSNKSQ